VSAPSDREFGSNFVTGAARTADLSGFAKVAWLIRQDSHLLDAARAGSDRSAAGRVADVWRRQAAAQISGRRLRSTAPNTKGLRSKPASPRASRCRGSTADEAASLLRHMDAALHYVETRGRLADALAAGHASPRLRRRRAQDQVDGSTCQCDAAFGINPACFV